MVEADADEQYEVFRIDSTSPLRLVSQQNGRYNQLLSLAAGNYLVLADCSHAIVSIKPQTLTKLHTYHLEFIPPHKPQANFPLQCVRFSKTNARQHLHNKFNLYLLYPQKNILVASTQLSVNFKEKRHLKFFLSALRVVSQQAKELSTPFFCLS